MHADVCNVGSTSTVDQGPLGLVLIYDFGKLSSLLVKVFEVLR